MQILYAEPDPFHTIEYVVGPGSSRIRATLPFFRITVTGLPLDLKALIATSDLQGVVCSENGTQRLLSEMVAFELDVMRRQSQLPDRPHTAALLVGDLHPFANEFDVQDIWFSFARRCRWVVGVAGNHDSFGNTTTSAGARRALRGHNVTFLDNDFVIKDGLKICGLSGIIGTSTNCWTRPEKEFAHLVGNMANQLPQIILIHDGPNIARTNLSGWATVRRAVETAPPTLVIRGHDNWRDLYGTLENGTQILNVEGRVVVLTS